MYRLLLCWRYLRTRSLAPAYSGALMIRDVILFPLLRPEAR
jgi:hypothetical protein